MSLLLARDRIDERRAAAAGPLAPLLASIRADLAPLYASPPRMHPVKARLTRAGGICPRDGSRLVFDPWSADAHRCAQCGGVRTGEAHFRSWLMWHHLWLAERAVHGALLHVLDGDADGLAVATTLLGQFAGKYLDFPNRDNALGPARVFFSTYLESIWLLQVCIALDLLEHAGAASTLAPSVRERVVEPAVRLIASFDEGGSNRQVWNSAAMFAAGRLLGDDALAERALEGRSGVVALLSHGLLRDGSWYEGENYHVFAHRGLWYGLTMGAAAGYTVPAPLVERFDAGFVTPWLTALPDMTMPSRRDSPHAVSLRQWRFAELAELGLARRDDDRLRGALAELYRTDMPAHDTGRSRSAADVERNEPPTRLTRADLGWRALLHARPELGALRPVDLRSALLEGQGLGVLRREGGRIYVALDYGHSGGGHGHPDRLNVILCDGITRWLDDPGTGSYVSPTLHWYRSTLAHNAPLVDGRSQARVAGELVAFDESGEASLVEAAVSDIAPGVTARRSIIAMPDYVVDTFEWSARRSVRMELPVHVDGTTRDVRRWDRLALTGGGGLEDGFDFACDAERATSDEGTSGGSSRFETVLLDAAGGDTPVLMAIHADPPIEWWRATAPGVPDAPSARFHLARWLGTSGRLTTIWDLRGTIRTSSRESDAIVIRRADGSRHSHRRTADGWLIEIESDMGARTIRMAAPRAASGSRPPQRAETRQRIASAPVPDDGHAPGHRQAAPSMRIGRTPSRFELGESHYRRSELSWAEAGRPRAEIFLSRSESYLVAEIAVSPSGLSFTPRDAVNEMDNEHPDINGDGVQLHLLVPAGAPRQGGALAFTRPHAAPEPARALLAGWMAVPEPHGRVRVREIAGSGAGWAPDADWRPTADGYTLRLRIPIERLGLQPPGAFALDILVNETAPGRERRRGQLVLSGGRGEWVYLRGDRQPPERFLPFLLDDA